MANILLIEDSATDAHVYGSMLRSHGHEVMTASSGEEGLALAEERNPDVIIMDIVMPGVNGFQATRELQQHKDTAAIPIIMVSTKDQDIDRIWGLRQGAFDYLVKPIKKRVLLKTVVSALESKAAELKTASSSTSA